MREAEPAIFARYHHAEELLAAHKVPDFGRKVAIAPVQRPVIDQCAQLAHRAVHEGLLLWTERCRWHGQKLIPIRIAAEDRAIPPDCSGIDRFSFRLRNWRHKARRPAENGA